MSPRCDEIIISHKNTIKKDTKVSYIHLGKKNSNVAYKKKQSGPIECETNNYTIVN